MALRLTSAGSAVKFQTFKAERLVTPDAPKLMPSWLKELDGKRTRFRFHVRVASMI